MSLYHQRLTPWHSLRARTLTHVKTSTGSLVASFENEADANFVVLAANSYRDLLEALQFMKKWHTEEKAMGFPGLSAEIIDHLDAAITKATT